MPRCFVACIAPHHAGDGHCDRIVLAYNAIAFGLPVIISSFLAQSVLTTILASLALNLCFAFAGGLISVRIVPKFGAWNLTVIGYAFQLAALVGLAIVGKPATSAQVVLAIAFLAAFLLEQGIGPGSHSMTLASLSYPTSLRGVGVGFNQTLMRASSTGLAVPVPGVVGGARHESVLDHRGGAARRADRAVRGALGTVGLRRRCRGFRRATRRLIVQTIAAQGNPRVGTHRNA